MTLVEKSHSAGHLTPAAPQFLSRHQLSLTLAALGVVYGDIGTSPLYAVRQSMLAVAGVGTHEQQVLGVMSLILWSLFIIVTLKYAVLIMRADNEGEGGVLALAQLAQRSPRLSRMSASAIAMGGLVGLALFYGDGLLTPAISVLSAVEGITLNNAAMQPLVVPVTLIILVSLFVIQSRGTSRVGLWFGPIMVVWFGVLGTLGLLSAMKTPEILWAIDPSYGINLIAEAPRTGFIALGAVFLAVTGAEVLYADMGHLGKRAIRSAWMFFVLPALVLNYLGQTAAILRDPSQVPTAFYSVAPAWAHYPLVILATIATVIASQAVISGIFSITHQAVQLGLLPRMEVRHTSASVYGQVYVPRMNWLLLAGIVLIVLIFKTSGALASAYGVAVSGEMIVTTTLVVVIALKQWRWSPAAIVLVCGSFFVVDVAFFSANATKVLEGGWFPLAVAAAVWLFMNAWRTGRRALDHMTYGSGMSVAHFLERADKTPLRVPGTAVFVTPRLDEMPGSLLHNLKHNQVLHERVVLLRVDVAGVPFVPPQDRVSVKVLGRGFYAVEVHYGFFQTPDVPAALERARAFGLSIDPEQTTFFVRRERLVPARFSPLPKWKRYIFVRAYSAAQDAAHFFRLPPSRVVEMGSQTEF